MIYDYRALAGLSQKELAELVGTLQFAINRLESAEYEGHSLSMLDRIARAINRKLSVDISPRGPEADIIRFPFRELIRGLRRKPLWSWSLCRRFRGKAQLCVKKGP
jgi:transcriptional regulator with XRE-family HTH domain